MEGRPGDQAVPMFETFPPQRDLVYLIIAGILPGSRFDRLARLLRHLRRQVAPMHADQLRLARCVEPYNWRLVLSQIALRGAEFPRKSRSASTPYTCRISSWPAVFAYFRHISCLHLAKDMGGGSRLEPGLGDPGKRPPSSPFLADTTV